MTKAKLQVFVALLVMAAIAVNTWLVFVLMGNNNQHHSESAERFTKIERLIERRIP